MTYRVCEHKDKPAVKFLVESTWDDGDVSPVIYQWANGSETYALVTPQPKETAAHFRTDAGHVPVDTFNDLYTLTDEVVD